MTEVVRGIVEEVIDNGVAKGSGIRVGGLKYGVYDPTTAGLSLIQEGIEVSFRYKATEKEGGIVYKNIQGKITPIASGGEPVMPTPVTDRQNSIERQNALTNAVQYFANFGTEKEASPGAVIEIARKFHEYTSGNLDAYMEELTENEDSTD